MDYSNKKVLVVGMAKSGIASAKLLLEKGATVLINDRKTAEQLGAPMEALLALGALNALGQDPMQLLDVDLIVLSPAVPLQGAFAQEALRRNIQVIGEIELGYREAKAPMVCITGTNGKTTTTALTGEIFQCAGCNTFVLGNIGIPITQEAMNTTPTDIIVAEVAGFQLESTIEFHSPSCAVLNISQDHLDRFGTMENYIASKEMILQNQCAQDFATLNFDDAVVRAMSEKTKARVLFFSIVQEVENGAFVRDGKILFKLDGVENYICRADELLIPGTHNLQNALAACCCAMAMGICSQAVAQAFRTFAGVEHRIEFVREFEGVRYIHDSKGTNPDSTIKAVQAAVRPTVLLLGGSNKNSDYTPVFGAFDKKIKAVVALGETRSQIVRDANKTAYADIYVCDGTFCDALAMAKALAVSGDDVLLSPACASYDMFDNFEQRGRVFKEIVNKF